MSARPEIHFIGVRGGHGCTTVATVAALMLAEHRPTVMAAHDPRDVTAVRVRVRVRGRVRVRVRVRGRMNTTLVVKPPTSQDETINNQERRNQ